ncbi:MAG: PEPxxWA-CTERM sorting domain-containing protein [Sphingomonas sp.]
MKSVFAAAVLAATCVAVPARAGDILVTSGTGQRAYALGFFGNASGQSFTSIDSTLKSIGFQFEGLNPTFTGGTYTLSLIAGESLTGTALVTRTFTLPTAINSRTPVWFDIDIGNVAATIGQRYTAVLNSSDTRNGIVLGPDINLNTGVPLTGDAYAGGRAIFATVPYSTCNNTATSICDFNFRVNGTTAVAGVPEPATWGMIILGFGALAGVVRRRSAASPRVRYA